MTLDAHVTFIMMLRPVDIKGLEKSMTFCLSAVMVKGAIAMSAS